MSLTIRNAFGLLGLSLLALPVSAMAQSSEPQTVVDQEAPTPAAAPGRYFVFRLAALGAQRNIYDVSAWGAGGELTLGGEGEMHGGYYNLRLMRGETKAGLTVTEAALLGSYELRVSGVRLGVGGGVTLLRINRITNGGNLDAWGYALFGRVGYDFGERSGPYVLGQIEVQPPHGWGPTLYAGYRF